jgi:hypothetical protein
MPTRSALALTASAFAVLPGAAFAQEAMSYETGAYEYAQPLPELDDDVVTETVAEPLGVDPRSAGCASPGLCKQAHNPGDRPIGPSILSAR